MKALKSKELIAVSVGSIVLLGKELRSDMGKQGEQARLGLSC
jgi:hypothetical protein